MRSKIRLRWLASPVVSLMCVAGIQAPAYAANDVVKCNLTPSGGPHCQTGTISPNSSGHWIRVYAVNVQYVAVRDSDTNVRVFYNAAGSVGPVAVYGLYGRYYASAARNGNSAGFVQICNYTDVHGEPCVVF
ncbi:hypothetical protein [Actinoplanes regularis]|uniref:Peptidase inhibitor family I36 n=1 Tax=Actinoplanes regularis TaxID=52697 RepID=A0A238Z9Q0_9ACTN|nr:hypothetical protein [Actinoplanes regularis]GIE85899.1 hypothetical protein Are01nite_23790 [Actinoplanes regularis]SNR79464.1 hypothetical protein SAMN06264365_105510 [Actinoplanes regularis]